MTVMLQGVGSARFIAAELAVACTADNKGGANDAVIRKSCR